MDGHTIFWGQDHYDDHNSFISLGAGERRSDLVFSRDKGSPLSTFPATLRFIFPG